MLGSLNLEYIDIVDKYRDSEVKWLSMFRLNVRVGGPHRCSRYLQHGVRMIIRVAVRETE